MNKYFECEICGKIYKTEQEVVSCENACKAKELKAKELLANKEKRIEEIKKARQSLRELEDKFKKDFEAPYGDLTDYYKALSDFYRMI
jgi:glycogen debranching enzyme